MLKISWYAGPRKIANFAIYLLDPGDVADHVNYAELLLSVELAVFYTNTGVSDWLLDTPLSVSRPIRAVGVSRHNNSVLGFSISRAIITTKRFNYDIRNHQMIPIGQKP